MSWGMPLLYVGPAFELPRHRKAVGFLCVGLDDDLEIEAPGRRHRARSLFVEPAVPHHLAFHGRKIACLYVDGSSPLQRSIIDHMTPAGDGLHTDHRGLGGIIEALHDEDALQEANRARIARVFGLSPWVSEGVDYRMGRTIGAILSDPAGRHPARALGRDVRLSESRIRRAFRDSTGTPLRRFRLWARMGCGLNLIGRGASLTSAAHEAGFCSSAHLSSAYRAMFGLTPSAVVRANPLLSRA